MLKIGQKQREACKEGMKQRIKEQIRTELATETVNLADMVLIRELGRGEECCQERL